MALPEALYFFWVTNDFFFFIFPLLRYCQPRQIPPPPKWWTYILPVSCFFCSFTRTTLKRYFCKCRTDQNNAQTKLQIQTDFICLCLWVSNWRKGKTFFFNSRPQTRLMRQIKKNKFGNCYEQLYWWLLK